MTKLILIGSDNEKRNSVITNFSHDLGSLIRIRGFQFKKYFDDLGHLVALDWFSFLRRETLFTLQFDRPDLPLYSQIQPFLEDILRELSIFQLIDVFLFDELGLIEPFVKPLQQQLITIFSSKHSVIATVNRTNRDKLDYLNRIKDIQYQTIDEQNNDKFYLKLIGELYDR